jgi:NADP-dependent 3-hydroxy acid dehydrogenase YdfG
MTDHAQQPAQVAVVTGASRGYGNGIARALAEAGYRVVATARSEDELKELASEVGAHTVVADVAHPKDWDRVFAETQQQFGDPDVLVNNAGAGIAIQPLDEQDDQQIATSIAVNLTGQLYGCRRAAQVMRKAGRGLIVNIASVCATHAWPGWSVYSAAKAGLRQAGRCMDTELRSAGVRVTTVLPSWGRTSFVGAADLTDAHPAGDPDIARQCIGPEDLGGIVAHLCQLPPHLVVQELTVWPMVQEVEPL